MKITRLLLILLLIATKTISAQNIDSLRNVVNQGNDEEQWKTLMKLANYYFYLIPDSAEFFYNKALDIAKKNNWHKKEATVNLYVGILYNERGNLTQAENYFKKSLELAKNINDSAIWIASLGNLGNTEINRGEYDKALDYFTEIVSLYEKMHNFQGLGNTYGAIGNIYNKIQNNDKALHYYEVSRQFFLSADDSLSAEVANMNIAGIYLKMRKYDDAENLYKLAATFFKQHQQKLNEAVCYGGLADLYIQQKEYEKSLKEYKKSIAILKEIKADSRLADTYLEMAKYFEIVKNNSKAVAYYDSAYNLALDLKNYPLLEKITGFLQDYYAQRNNYKTAYEYSLLHKTYSDSFVSAESMKRFKELEVQFETKQKEQQIELLTKEKQIAEEKNKRQRLWIIILFISIASSVGIFLLLYNRKKLIEAQKQMILQQKLQRLQMNPHFIYNSLLLIQNFMIENDTKQASEYLSGFSRLMRKILESTRKDFISLDEEIEILNLYVKLQKLRSKNNFEFKLSIDDSIDTEITLIPPMLIQPFIENAIKHAFDETTDHPLISLDFKRIDNSLKITIKDNGKGYDPDKKSSDHKSLALEIVKERLQNIYPNEKVVFNIENLADKSSKGTMVTLIIPVKEEF